MTAQLRQPPRATRSVHHAALCLCADCRLLFPPPAVSVFLPPPPGWHVAHMPLVGKLSSDPSKPGGTHKLANLNLSGGQLRGVPLQEGMHAGGRATTVGAVPGVYQRPAADGGGGVRAE